MADERSLFHPALRPFIDRARIDCEQMFAFRCPKYWGELRETDDRLTRYCGECKRSVHLATDEPTLRRLAEAGECVAVVVAAELPDPSEARPEPVTLMGMIEADY